jgi:hypothetical protein
VGKWEGDFPISKYYLRIERENKKTLLGNLFGPSNLAETGEKIRFFMAFRVA